MKNNPSPQYTLSKCATDDPICELSLLGRAMGIIASQSAARQDETLLLLPTTGSQEPVGELLAANLANQEQK